MSAAYDNSAKSVLAPAVANRYGAARGDHAVRRRTAVRTPNGAAAGVRTPYGAGGAVAGPNGSAARVTTPSGSAVKTPHGTYANPKPNPYTGPVWSTKETWGRRLQPKLNL